MCCSLTSLRRFKTLRGTARAPASVHGLPPPIQQDLLVEKRMYPSDRRSAFVMADLITAVILLTFGGGMAVIVAGFYVLTHKSRDSPFRTDDYANYAPRPGRPRYSPQSTFRREQQNLRKAGANKKLVIVIALIFFLVIAAAATTFSNSIDILLFLVLLSPFLLSLLRVRKRERDEERSPDDRRSSP